ncbi:MAG: potassium transporter TrkG, partial [Bacillota bacterium]|nr:potassium transporter TrkG [Bacillota bacterium]
GGLGFSVILDIIRVKTFKKLTIHSKLVVAMTAILLSIGFLLFFILEFTNPSTIGNLNFGDKVVASLFQSVTARTAGFNTIDTAGLTDSSKFLTVILMFIGGSPGSTAGGIKTTTFAIVIISIIAILKGRDDTELFNRRLSRDVTDRVLVVFGIAISLVVFVTFLLTISEGNKEFLDIFFETISAFGTVGLSTGITSDLSSLGKIIISLTMFSGRVGPVTVVIALAHRHKKKNSIRYPEGKISVG